MALTARATGHPLELISITLILFLLVAWATGFVQAISFFVILFVGFLAAILLIGGGYMLTRGAYFKALIALIVGFSIIGIIGAGWLSWG
jgi:hypothetical protein